MVGATGREAAGGNAGADGSSGSARLARLNPAAERRGAHSWAGRPEPRATRREREAEGSSDHMGCGPTNIIGGDF